MAALSWATLRVTKRRVHNEFYFEISPLQFVELNRNLIFNNNVYLVWYV